MARVQADIEVWDLARYKHYVHVIGAMVDSVLLAIRVILPCWHSIPYKERLRGFGLGRERKAHPFNSNEQPNFGSRA